MREETQPKVPMCAICNQPITQEQWPYKGLDGDKKAHLACYLEHMHDDEKNGKD